MSADDALAVENGNEKKKPGPEPKARDKAVEWLEDLLRDGPMATARIKEEAKEAEAVESLPDLSLSEGEAATATGTDGPEEWTPQWTPELTPTAFSACSRVSADGTDRVSGLDESEIHKHARMGELGAASDRMAHVGSDKEEKPTVGFEPTTPGLQNQSSTVELRWLKFIIDKALC